MENELIFLGFAAVKPMDWSDWLPEQSFAWIASVDGMRPHNWVDLWDFNLASCWDTEEDAWRFVPAGEEPWHRLCAYRLHPVFYRTGDAPRLDRLSHIFPLASESLPPEPANLPGYRPLGFDVVGIGSIGSGPSIGFGTSPLSTNAMCRETAVNRYCLVDSFADAIAFAAKCNTELPEPEYYYVVQVLARDEQLPFTRTA